MLSFVTFSSYDFMRFLDMQYTDMKPAFFSVANNSGSNSRPNASEAVGDEDEERLMGTCMYNPYACLRWKGQK
ncbi:hypothetical protein E2542_SST19459 [Spatholobus suberectus]|nr:hypothetical protein E2542_SST19459 [Spatholobus suberectus]